MSKVRIVSGTLAALTLAAALAAPAEARDRNRGMSPGAAAVVGAMGGLAVGALVAGAGRPAYAAPAPAYGAPVYGAAPVYAAPRPVYVEPVCYVERQREYVRGWGWQIRERTVCD